MFALLRAKTETSLFLALDRKKESEKIKEMYEDYSEVGIVIRKKDEEHYWEKVKAWDKKYGLGGDTVRALLFFARKRIVYSDCLKEDCIVLHWKKISWRPEYRSINFFK